MRAAALEDERVRLASGPAGPQHAGLADPGLADHFEDDARAALARPQRGIESRALVAAADEPHSLSS
jgi:hypothetical protein